jgi:hypothetical protein
MCTAVRYAITVPALSSRPLVPRALPTPINATGETVATSLPFIDIDHCEDCRRACGGLVQCWFICPQSWISFSLLSKVTTDASYVTYPCDQVATPSSEVLRTTYLGHYESSPQIHRCFCTRCGTGLTYCSSKDRGPNWTLGAIVDVAVGTMDHESIELVRPERHGWWNSGTGWIQDLMEGKSGWLIRHPSGRVDQEVKTEHRGA